MTPAKSIHENTCVENVPNGQGHAVLLLSYVAFSSYFYAKGGKFLFCSARPHLPPRVERHACLPSLPHSQDGPLFTLVGRHLQAVG